MQAAIRTGLHIVVGAAALAAGVMMLLRPSGALVCSVFSGHPCVYHPARNTCTGAQWALAALYQWDASRDYNPAPGLERIEAALLAINKWTLRVVVERGVLVFECRNCWHLSQMDELELVARFGPDALVGELRKRMVCRRCGSRRVRSLVRLKFGRKNLVWVPVPPR